MTTEWEVTCANGHRIYERVQDVRPDDIEWTPCPKCGASRRGRLLDEPT